MINITILGGGQKVMIEISISEIMDHPEHDYYDSNTTLIKKKRNSLPSELHPTQGCTGGHGVRWNYGLRGKSTTT